MTTPRTPRGVSAPKPTPTPILATYQAVGLPDMAVMVAGYPISVNQAYAGRKPTGRNRGTRRLSDSAVLWREAVIVECRAWLAAQRTRIAQPAIWWRLPLAVRITVYGVRGDADNYSKLICDGLKHALGYDRITGKLLIDDRHFNPVTMCRGASRGVVPGCLIEVWQTPAEEVQASA